MAQNTLSGPALLPTHMYFTTGTGVHARELQAHDLMYMDAGLGRVNRVQVSSRVPPGCTLLPPEQGGELLQDGQILFAIQALARTDEPGAQIATAVGVAIPEDGSVGCVAEVHEDDSQGKTAQQAADKAVQMALTAMALEWGDAHFDALAVYSPSTRDYTIGGRTVHTHSAAAEATGPANGDYVKIVACLVFLF
ncbi:pyruvoyl-dependent arginine decarboxylase [Streptomyces candidus]|uniref:Pyruvoyl-dependent arginine decarboxylase AaxB n=1 Tax=Streptomyces candidus TaxID=67283 RepID=A0A7X0HKS1_9ACTN|nr:pyruvoyl-dependent arginine decarboxylase [Streptomyces candidus]MBB6439494.1 pyruvoyl-dependent arginine decarboxylase [Streptomyces candidus]